jgi:hypothetical protein
MFNNGYVKASVVVCMLVSLFALSVATAAPTLQNGDFSGGLTGWTVEYGTVTDGGGYALFQEDTASLSSTLTQTFNLPVGSQTLSFDVWMSSVTGGDYDPFAWPDAFTASLLDPVTFAPLIFNPGFNEFYYLDNTGVEQTVGAVSGNTVTLDVSALAGQDVFLSFDLWGSLDGMQTTVGLDNVNVSGVNVVPAPGALLLGSIGVGLVSWLRRSKVVQ